MVGLGQHCKGTSYASAVAGQAGGLPVTSWKDTGGGHAVHLRRSRTEHCGALLVTPYVPSSPHLNLLPGVGGTRVSSVWAPSSEAHGCWNFQVPAAWPEDVTMALARNVVLSVVTAHGKVGVSSPLQPESRSQQESTYPLCPPPCGLVSRHPGPQQPQGCSCLTRTGVQPVSE